MPKFQIDTNKNLESLLDQIDNSMLHEELLTDDTPKGEEIW